MKEKDTVTMERNGQKAEVTPPPDPSVQIMEAQGWKLVSPKKGQTDASAQGGQGEQKNSQGEQSK